MRFNGVLAMFEFPCLFNGVPYLNKRRAIDILNIVLLVHVGCVAVACRVPEKQAIKQSPVFPVIR